MNLEAPPYGIAPWGLDSTTTIADPPAGSFRVDSTTAPTAFALDDVDRLGVDQSTGVFADLTEGDRLVVQQMRNASRYLVFDVGAPVDHGGWWEIPVATSIGQTGVLVTGQDWLFVWRHAVAGDEDVPLPPAALVPAVELDDLVAALVTALIGEVNADAVRDADKLDRAARAAIDDVATYLDSADVVYASVEDVNPRVFAGLVDLAAAILKRPGFAYGVAGYDEADPLAIRARGAVLAAIGPGLKERWGVA